MKAQCLDYPNIFAFFSPGLLRSWDSRRSGLYAQGQHRSRVSNQPLRPQGDQKGYQASYFPCRSAQRRSQRQRCRNPCSLLPQIVTVNKLEVCSLNLTLKLGSVASDPSDSIAQESSDPSDFIARECRLVHKLVVLLCSCFKPPAVPRAG